ncbi:MAG: hypothetical protein U0X92_12205 [Anaerolineales bacterium]
MRKKYGDGLSRSEHLARMYGAEDGSDALIEKRGVTASYFESRQDH